MDTDRSVDLLTTFEPSVAEDRQDCYWLYVVTGCKSELTLQKPIKDQADFRGMNNEVDHNYLSVDALTQPMQVPDKSEPYGRGVE